MTQKRPYPWEKRYPEFVKWDHTIEAKPVFSLLEETADKFPDAPAFNFMGKQYSWGEINHLSDKLAKGLQGQGLKKGDKVGLLLPNCPLFLISYYGILKAGGTVVNYNPLYARSELEHQINDSLTRFMITANLAILCDNLHSMPGKTFLEKIFVCDFTQMLSFPKSILFKLFKRGDIAQLDFDNKRISSTDDLFDNDGQ
ncbi:MAG: hypothetical protein CMH32_03330 [Micavibrio sp.]|nr:hypothetical protein [Micavibrio sp.]